MRRPRSPSLLWTFAGAFLGVLALGAVLQWVAVTAVLAPMRRSGTRDRAELMARQAAAAIGRLPAAMPLPGIRAVLESLHDPEAPILLVYHGDHGEVVSSRPVPPVARRDLDAAIGRWPVRAWMARPRAEALPGRPRVPRFTGPPRRPRFRDDSTARALAEGLGLPFPPPPGRWRGEPPPPPGLDPYTDRPPGSPGVDDGPSDGSWEEPPPFRPDPEREFSSGERVPAPPGDPLRPTPGPLEPGPFPADTPRVPPIGARIAFEVLFRDTLRGGGPPRGEVVALLAEGRGPRLDPPERERLLLYVPLAIAVAGLAGLLLFRAQVARLRALERLATRVASGDLAARVGDESPDEIGRLSRQLDRMTEAMAADRRELEAADRQRRRLFADISHELATPLTSLRGFTETMLDPGVRVSDEERVEYLRRMLAEAERLDLLIRDLLDLARLEGGAAPLERAALDWAALARNTVERFRPRFEAEGLTLEWRGPLERAAIEGDGRRLEQVLDNLLENARRYVPRGGRVEVTLEPGGRDLPAGFSLSVRDDGPGVPEADLPHLFERFRRGHATREVPGSGLGLAIVSEIVQRHGGVVRAEGRAPRGVAFVVELPASP